MKTLLLIDSIDRDETEDPVYLDKIKTCLDGFLSFSLGDRAKLLSSKHKNRILGICFWKFSNGYYFIKPWEEFLGCPISPNGVTFVSDICPNIHCATPLVRNPKDPQVYCHKCNRAYSKICTVPHGIVAFEKYIEKLKQKQFCHACGKKQIDWKSEDVELCNSCFMKHGDLSFVATGTGTKIPVSAEIMLMKRGA